MQGRSSWCNYKLLDLAIRTENGIVPMDARARADLIDLMARILVVVFQAEGGSVDDGIVDRGPVQSQDQAVFCGRPRDSLDSPSQRVMMHTIICSDVPQRGESGGGYHVVEAQ